MRTLKVGTSRQKLYKIMVYPLIVGNGEILHLNPLLRQAFYPKYCYPIFRKGPAKLCRTAPSCKRTRRFQSVPESEETNKLDTISIQEFILRWTVIVHYFHHVH
jgi:hypothetical protein